MFKHARKTIALVVASVASIALMGAASASAVTSAPMSPPTPSRRTRLRLTPATTPLPGTKCTWVLNDAYGNAGGEKAPQSGKLKSIKLVAGEAGSFKLQLVKVRGDGSAKVLAQGPKVTYEGQDPSMDPDDPYKVEKFKLDNPMPVQQGAQIAIVAKKTSTLRCSSGGDNTLLFDPPLEAGNPFAAPTNDDGCWMLIEGEIK